MYGVICIMHEPLTSDVTEQLTEAWSSLLVAENIGNEAPLYLTDSDYKWHRVRDKARRMIVEHDELTDIEKAGWLLAIENPDITIPLANTADMAIQTLRSLDNELKKAGELVLLRAELPLEDGSTHNLFTTSGEGLVVHIRPAGLMNFSLGSAEHAKPTPLINYVRPAVILAANVESQTDTAQASHTAYLKGGRKRGACLTIGTDRVVKYTERLFLGSGAETTQKWSHAETMDIWKMAKKLGFRLDQDSEVIAQALRGRQLDIAFQIGKRLVDNLREGQVVIAIDLDPEAGYCEVTPDMVKTAATNYNDSTHHLAAQRLAEL